MWFWIPTAGTWLHAGKYKYISFLFFAVLNDQMTSSMGPQGKHVTLVILKCEDRSRSEQCFISSDSNDIMMPPVIYDNFWFQNTLLGHWDVMVTHGCMNTEKPLAS